MSDVVRATGPEDLPVAVVGAGTVGLAAAAHLLRRGLEPVALEPGPAVGASVREWGHVPTFSSWRLNIDRASAAPLGEPGWSPMGRAADRGRGCPYGGNPLNAVALQRKQP